MAVRRIPVVIVAGFLGAGKTTLLNHLLHNREGARIGVVVNDFGSVNIDSMMVAGQVDSTVTLSNGCLCCAVGPDDLEDMFASLAHRTSDLDVIVVEASGLAEPRNMIRLVVGAQNPHLAYGGLVVLVDAAAFDEVRERHPEIEQHVALADVLVLNKIDLCDDDAGEDLLAELCRLNTRAAIVPTSHGRIPPGLLFDLPEKREPLPGEQLSFDELFESAPHEHGPDGCREVHLHDAYSAVTVTLDAPLDPRALVAALEDQPSGVFRSKGYVRLRAGGRTHVHSVQTVGDHIRFEPARTDPGTSTLVVIGTDLDEAHVTDWLGRTVADDPPVDAMFAVHRYSADTAGG